MAIKVTKVEAHKLSMKLEDEVKVEVDKLAALTSWQLRERGDAIRAVARKADRAKQLHEHSYRKAPRKRRAA